MCWSGRALLVVSILVGGCAEHTPCGLEEVCNYQDDDCDGQIDEDFRDEEGGYFELDDCGACGVRCADVHPHATEVECAPHADSYGCFAVACEDGFHLFNRACVPDVEVLCLPCANDEDCSIFQPGATCLEVGGSLRCMRPCDDGCPEGYECAGGECRPETGSCACTPEAEGVAFACLLQTASAACAGRQLCADGELTICEPAFDEICNGEDDDCDGSSDEDFIDDAGRYVHIDHCGECNAPCAPSGPHYEASCVVEDGSPICMEDCEDGFADIDLVRSNGCECEYGVGTWPPSRLGVDADCDGEIDSSDEFVFVATWGSHDADGTLIDPLRTIAEGTDLAARLDKTVVVTGGIFQERLEVVGGVEVYGGYAADFTDRDPALYPTELQPRDGLYGTPVLTCHGVTAHAVVGGMTIMGSDAVVPGAGSTAVYLDGCTSAVELVDLVVFSGRGADGRPGADSSDNLAEWGLSSLLELDGDRGRDGADGFPTESPDCTTDSVPGGDGGRHTCAGTSTAVDGGGGGDAVCVDGRCRVGAPCGNGGCTDFMVGDECDMDAVLAAAVPNPPGEDGMGPGGGSGGASTYNAPTDRDTCSFCDDNPTLARVGENGEDGSRGESGDGGSGCSDPGGVFTPATGIWTSGPGGDGEVGRDGGGGGGGSCGAGYDVISGVVGCADALGGSGGGGGSGGCGAPRASGGDGAGSSIGVAVRLPPGTAEGPRCEGVAVVASVAGNGGPGGIGAAGGSAGHGGLGGGTAFWCSRRGGRGGDGGDGGDGGGGGGGCGGSVSGFHVIASGAGARAYRDALESANHVEGLPAGGRGGPGGFSPGQSGTSGADGTAEAFRLVE